MTRWLAAAIIGMMVAALHYGVPGLRPRVAASARIRWLALLARALGAMMIAALLLDAPVGRERPRPPLVALDASASWRRGGDAGSRWSDAAARARTLAGDSVLLVGDSARVAPVPAVPSDARTAPTMAADRAREEGRALHLFSDGEGVLPAGALPPGSRVEVFRRPAYEDLAMVALELPARAVPGDTIQARLTLRAGAAGSSSASVFVALEGVRATQSIPPLPAFGEREVTIILVAPAASGPRLLRAATTMRPDAEPRNDTLTAAIEFSKAPVAVLVSTSPDPDAREAFAALRGALSATPRGYYLVAPGQWRTAESLAAVDEATVRRALAAAPIAVIHGDSARTAALRVAAGGSRVLMIPSPPEMTGEWRAAATTDSPLAPTLAGVAWDSVPPIDPASREARGEWIALRATSGDGASRAVVAGTATGAGRTVTVAASGLWRWRSRGGRARVAHDALWGSIIDWVAASRPDARAALPATTLVREGERISWRRGGADSVVRAVLHRLPPQRADAVTRPDSIVVLLRFDERTGLAASAPLAEGIYEAVVGGGRSLLAVNASSEWLPTRQALRDTTIAGRATSAPLRSIRTLWWAYAAALAAICAEWMLRRRAGLR